MPDEYYFFIFLCIVAGIWTSFENAKKSGARTDEAVVDGFFKGVFIGGGIIIAYAPISENFYLLGGE